MPDAVDLLKTRRSIKPREMSVPGPSPAELETILTIGARVPDRVRPRIGDVVAAAHGRIGVFHRSVESFLSSLIGHHGSMTSAEQLVPFVVFKP